MEKDFRIIMDFPPVLLYKQDFLNLEKIIMEPNSSLDNEIKVELIDKEVHFRANSFKEILDIGNLPFSTDKLIIEYSGRNELKGERRIDRGLSLTFYHNHVSCQIHSFDEDWYNGKVSRLKSFLQKRKPWYHPIRNISLVFPAISMLFLFYASSLYGYNKYISWSPIIFALVLLLISYLAFKGKIFPYVKILFSDKKKLQFGLNEAVAVVVISQLILMVADFILKYKWSKP